MSDKKTRPGGIVRKWACLFSQLSTPHFEQRIFAHAKAAYSRIAPGRNLFFYQIMFPARAVDPQSSWKPSGPADLTVDLLQENILSKFN